MYEFLEYVLEELKNSFALAMVAVVLAVGSLGGIYILYRKKYKDTRRFPWKTAVVSLLLIGYLTVVLYATFLRYAGGIGSVNLHLFRAWREAWNNFSAKSWANVLLNVAMFVPLGALVPLLGKKFQEWYIPIPLGFAVSGVIELLQLAANRGICDVDDLFANTMGTVLGYLLVMTLLSLLSQKGKRLKPALLYGSLSAAFLLSISGIFLAYELKEFGNLPMAAAYTNNTRNVTWKIEASLPPAQDLLPVYQTQNRSIPECDAFAEEFKSIIDTEYTTITYYQDAAYYMDQNGDDNGAHFLFVSYLDTGYEYTLSMGDQPEYSSADRTTIEKALEKYPVMIPRYAQFNQEEDGWHSFTVTQYIDGAIMMDGQLRCRYAADGTIREIENHLLAYSYYDTIPVISPQEAYRRLCGGQFNDFGYFEYHSPTIVTVTACELRYEVDTKGFYQPVYAFSVISDDGKYEKEILIPAML